MPVGVHAPIFPRNQPAAEYPLIKDDCYFLIRLHRAQVYHHSAAKGLLTSFRPQPRFLTVGTTVQSSHGNNPAVRSLHRCEEFVPNAPYQPGWHGNLTDWLPAGNTDWIKVKVQYTITRTSPLAGIIKLIDQNGLLAKLSLLSTEWAVALKVAEIVTELASTWEKDHADVTVFNLDTQFNVSTLQSGYHITLGSEVDTPWPEADSLSVTADGQLQDTKGLLSSLNYAVFQALALPRRGMEAVRGQAWGQLLQIVADRIQLRGPNNDPERRKANAEWRATLERVNDLAQADRSFLRSEIQQVIRQFHQQLEPILALPTRLQGTLEAGDGGFPNEWQELLGVQSVQELQLRVDAYSRLIEATRPFRARYSA
jgi:hypothetical protein